MSNLSFAEKLSLEHGDKVMLYSGVTQEGRNFFAYLQCNKADIEKLEHDFANQQTGDLDEYGRIIYLDFRDAPDAKADAYLDQYVERLNAIFSA